VEELALPYYLFNDAGEHITLASPNGGEHITLASTNGGDSNRSPE
jgi:putative intracellular protease/amidase